MRSRKQGNSTKRARVEITTGITCIEIAGHVRANGRGKLPSLPEDNGLVSSFLAWLQEVKICVLAMPFVGGGQLCVYLYADDALRAQQWLTKNNTLLWCAKCKRQTAHRVDDEQGWDGACNHCGFIAQSEVLEECPQQ